MMWHWWISFAENLTKLNPIISFYYQVFAWDSDLRKDQWSSGCLVCWVSLDFFLFCRFREVVRVFLDGISAIRSSFFIFGYLWVRPYGSFCRKTAPLFDIFGKCPFHILRDALSFRRCAKSASILITSANDEVPQISVIPVLADCLLVLL